MLCAEQDLVRIEPFLMEAQAQLLMGLAESPCPVLNTQGFTLVGEPEVSPSVSCLFSSSSPSAVLRGVGAVVVDALDRVFGGWFPTHIGQEVRVGSSPTGADNDPTAAVILPGGVVGVVATVVDMFPTSVLRAPAISVGGAMFPMETPAGLGTPVSEGRPPDFFLDAAIAPTPPHDTLPSSLASIPQDNKAPESLPGKVFDGHTRLLTQGAGFPPSPELLGGAGEQRPAVALAEPRHQFPFVGSAFNHEKFPEPLSGQVFDFGH